MGEFCEKNLNVSPHSLCVTHMPDILRVKLYFPGTSDFGVESIFSNTRMLLCSNCSFNLHVFLYGINM